MFKEMLNVLEHSRALHVHPREAANSSHNTTYN